MTEHEKLFDEIVAKKQKDAADEGHFVQGWSKDELDPIIADLDGWDGLNPKERSERNEARGKKRNLYKLKKKFIVVELPGPNGGGELQKVLVERTKDGEQPPLDAVKVVVPVQQ